MVVITGYATIQDGVEAMRNGAYDFLEKPLDRARLLVTLQNCLGHHEALADRALLVARSGSASPIIGDCSGIREVKSFIVKVAPSEGTVLITGENGTGKELVVNAIHLLPGDHTGEI